MPKKKGRTLVCNWCTIRFRNPDEVSYVSSFMALLLPDAMTDIQLSTRRTTTPGSFGRRQQNLQGKQDLPQPLDSPSYGLQQGK
jgi:hypothetical protein